MDLSTIVDVLSIIAVVSGLFFAGTELRQYRLSKDRESALELFNTFQSHDFMRGVRAITQLPDDQSKAEVEKLLGDRMDDLYFVIAILEGMGALVHKEELSLQLVEDFFSGIILMTWHKLSHFVRDERRSLGRETWMEWTQWLAERIQEREKARTPVPAHLEYQGWKAKA